MSARDLSRKRLLVTGGSGFVGQHVLATLRARGCLDISAPRRAECDLTREADVVRLFDELRPEVVIHLAAVVGGIGANRTHPGQFFYENALMGLLMVEQSRRVNVEKFVGVGTICSYPKFAPVPFKEDDLWNGYPEETNAPYGIAKKLLLVQGQAYRQQYGLNAIHVLPVNLYGPGDNFDPASSHVIPALIRKCLEARDAGQADVVIWGAGFATREFLYVEDCAEAFALATERYEQPEPVNIGAGFEISMRDLAKTIAEACHFSGEIVWDPTRPNGQPRRMLDVRRAKERFGWSAKTPLQLGLSRTIAWYRENQARIASSEASEQR